MNAIDLKGHTAIVTGGARGIGLTIAERLLDSGARCVLWDSDAATLTSAAAALRARGDVQTAVVDVTRAEQVDEVARAVDNFGGADALVNNAGITGGNKKSWEMSPEEWRHVLDVDL